MFRRIEVYGRIFSSNREHKAGAMGNDEACALMHDLHSPHNIRKHPVRFYFTEAGWNKFGRKMIDVLQKQKVQYKVIAVKENSLDYVYRDKYQVATRPRKKKTSKKTFQQRSFSFNYFCSFFFKIFFISSTPGWSKALSLKSSAL